MNATAIMLALAAAALHAGWNAFLRSGSDRLRAVTVMSLAMTVVAVPFAFVLPLPPAAAWPYLALSSGLQVGYSLFLVAAYRHGDLGQVYPIVRGSVPLLVTLGGFVLAGQVPAPGQLIGILLVGLGITSLALGPGRATAKPVLLALATGAFIASYVTVDAIGVRRAGHAAAYATWICLIYGTLLLACFVAIRGVASVERIAADLRSSETLKEAAGGMVSLLAYGAVIAAFALGPVGPVAALRETSVVFAALIGRLVLGESLTPRRIAACAVVALGAVCIGWQA